MSTWMEVAIVYGSVFLLGCVALFLVAAMIEKDSRERARKQGRKRKNWGNDW